MRPILTATLLAALPAVAASAQTRAGGELQVNTYTTGEQDDCHVALDDSGRFTVAWTGEDPFGGLEVFAQRHMASGARLGGEFQVNSTSSALMPSMAVRKGGALLTAWWSPQFGVLAQRYAPSGLPQGAEFQVNSFVDGGAYQYWPSAAPLPGGGFVVAWSYAGMSVPARIHARRFDAQGTPVGDEFLASGAPAGGLSDLFPSASAAGDGGFVVVWKHSATGTQLIQGRRYDGAGNGGPVFQVSQATAYGSSFPRVSMAHDGSFVVVWGTVTAAGFDEVHGRMFTPAATPSSPEFAVNPFTSGFQRFPSVATGFLGDFVVSWASRAQTAGSSYDVMARRFKADGTPRTGEFQGQHLHDRRPDVQRGGGRRGGQLRRDLDAARQDGSGAACSRSASAVWCPSALNVDTTVAGQRTATACWSRARRWTCGPAWRNVNGPPRRSRARCRASPGPPGAHVHR